MMLEKSSARILLVSNCEFSRMLPGRGEYEVGSHVGSPYGDGFVVKRIAGVTVMGDF